MSSIKLYKKVYKTINIITALATLMLLLCFGYSFDAQNGYLNKSPLTGAFTVTFIIGVAVSFVSVFLQSEFDVLETPSTLNTQNKWYYILAGLSALFVGVLGFVATEDASSNKILYVTGAGILMFGLYIASLFSPSGYSFKIPKLILLFLSISLPVALALANSTNYYHHINSIENKLTIVFAVFFLIYILFEAKRICLGYHSGWHMMSMFLVSMSGLSLSCAYLVAFTFDVVTEGHRFYQMLVILASSAFVQLELYRTLSTLTPKSKVNWDFQSRLTNASKASEEIKEAPTKEVTEVPVFEDDAPDTSELAFEEAITPHADAVEQEINDVESDALEQEIDDAASEITEDMEPDASVESEVNADIDLPLDDYEF